MSANLSAGNLSCLATRTVPSNAVPKAAAHDRLHAAEELRHLRKRLHYSQHAPVRAIGEKLDARLAHRAAAQSPERNIRTRGPQLMREAAADEITGYLSG